MEFELKPSMDVIKTEPDSDGERYSSAPLIDDLASVKLEELPVAVIKSEVSPSMDIVKTEPHSDGESNSSSPFIEDVISAKLQGLPIAVIKSGASEELWDITTVKNEGKDEVITGDCGVLQERVEQLNREREHCVVDGDNSISSSNIALVVKRGNNQIETTQSVHLLAHNRTHNEENTCSCVVSDGGAVDNCDLPVYQRACTGKNKFICDMCNKTFAQRVYLIKHKRIHTGEKPYMCKVCNKRFAQSGSLTTHKRTHTGERPYKCSMCSKGFVDNAALSKHRRVHTGEKPFNCEICSKSFSQSSCLVKHRQRAHWRKMLTVANSFSNLMKVCVEGSEVGCV